MCKEDIRIARAANGHSAVVTGGSTVAAIIMPPNPNRYSLAFQAMPTANDQYEVWVNIFTLVNNIRWPLATLTRDQPTAIINLYDVGQPITGEIWYVDISTSDPPVLYVGEAAFDQPLEKI